MVGKCGSVEGDVKKKIKTVLLFKNGEKHEELHPSSKKSYIKGGDVPRRRIRRNNCEGGGGKECGAALSATEETC